MRYAWILLLIPSALGSPIISEIHPEPDGGREFIELYNPTAETYDLTGHIIQDAAGNTFTFGTRALGPQERIVVWGGGDATPEGPAWSRASVWNNGGDTARLLLGEVVLDAMTYGGEIPAPGLGNSLYLDGDWKIGAPTPARAPGETGGTATATVENVPPTVSLGGPAAASPGQAVEVHITVGDENGDLVSWTLQHGTSILATGSGSQPVTLQAPSTGPFVLDVTATDGTHNASASRTIEIQVGALHVTMAAPITFPAMAPGARNVTSTPFRLENLGERSVTPRIDISSFRGPTSFVPDALTLLIAGQEIAYDGPLTPLPTLAAGASYDVQMRLAVPSPLPAGDYGTSFTVIP